MTEKAKKPRAPAGLGRAGGALWRDLVGAFELDERECAVLAAACRQADDLVKLEEVLAEDGLVVAGSRGQPRLTTVVAELRQGRLALARLLGALALPDEVGAKPVTSRSARASRAANVRWGKVRALREVGDDGAAAI